MKPIAVSFRTKVAVLLGGVVLLLGAMGLTQARSDMRRILGTELESRGSAIAMDLASHSVDPLLTGDLYGLYDIVNRTKVHNPDLRYVLVLSADGKVQANTFGEGVPVGLLDANTLAAGQPRQLRRIRTEEGLVRDVAVPILGGKLGTVRVGMSDKSVEAGVAENSRKLAALVAVAVIIGFAWAYALSYYLTRPLRRLLHAVGSVAEGNLSQRIPSPAGDEVGQLGKEFNAMTEALAQKEESRRALLGKVVSSQEEERKRVAHEIHDEPAQTLAAAIMQLDRLERRIDQGQAARREDVAHARQTVRTAVGSLHRIMLELRPMSLDELGLLPSIQRYAEQRLQEQGISTRFEVLGRPRPLQPEAETAIFRIVQEAVNNICRHAQADTVNILLEYGPRVLCSTVEDNGVGFDLEAASAQGVSLQARGLGVMGMKERANLLGGELVVDSSPGKGTRVSFTIPTNA